MLKGLLAASLVTALSVAVEIAPSSYHDENLSLPYLIEMKDIAQLEDWTVSNDVRLDTGRLLVDTNGLLLNKHKNNYYEWTFETTFRSTGGSHVDNGLSLWLIDLDNSLPDNYENLGGPVNYDGLQLVINNKESSGLKAYLNDGTKDFINSVDEAFGSCLFNYQGSQVPTTVRVSYRKNWFKIQVDNNLCLHTDAIKLPVGMTVGISAHSVNSEQFEILKADFYASVTEDAIDDHGIVSPLIATTTVIETQIPTKLPRQSLMERTRFQQQKILEDINSQHKEKDEKLGKFEELVDKLDSINSIDQLLHKFETKLNAEKSDDLQLVEQALATIIELQQETEKKMFSLSSDLEKFVAVSKQDHANVIRAIEDLTKTTIREIRDNSATMDELSKKIDVMALHSREATYEKNIIANDGFLKLETFITGIRWILIPLFAVVLVLVVFIYRLRHEIKHSKLL